MFSDSLRVYQRLLFAALAFLSFLLPLSAHAADYTAGAELNGSVATLWFKSNVNTSWVDAHYSVNGGAQQNLRMGYNTSKARFETQFSASAGQVVQHSFTYNNGGGAYDSPQSTTTLQPGGSAAAPSFSPPAGSYATAQSVTLASDTQGAVIRYTTDGSTPTATSAIYSGPVAVSTSGTLKAFASASGLAASSVSSASYSIGGNPTGYTHGVDVAGSNATLWFSAGAGLVWVDAHFNLGNGQQNVRMTYNASAGRHEQAIALGAASSISYSFTYFTNGVGAADTPVFTFKVNNDSQVATPSFSPPGGSYAGTQSVAISTATAGATIRYTMDGSTPNANSPLYAGPISVASSRTLKALAIKSGWINSLVASASYVISDTPPVATPSFSPAAGSYTGPQSVTISTSTPGASIRYTTDGSVPSAASTPYTGPVSVSTSSTLRAIGVKAGTPDSLLASAQYTITPVNTAFVQGVSESGATATVWFKPSVAMNFVIPHYRLGSNSQINPMMAFNPTLGRYETVINPVTAGKVITYSFTYAPVTGSQTDSEEYSYMVGPGNCTAKPVFSLPGGSYATTQSVTLSTSVPGASIRYTTDGSAPNTLSPAYTGPISVTKATTVNAIFIAPNQSQSCVASATYLIGGDSGTVATPVFSHPGGSYATRIRVNLLTSTVGATVRFTTDGSTPTATSTSYGGPIELSTAKTVKAMAFKDGMAASDVASASYTFSGTASSPWNGQTTFNIVNATKGRWANNQIYWAIIGKDWNTGNFVHVNQSGALVPMSLGDNGALMKNGLPYANYFYTLEQLASVTIPAINSARLLMSVGSPMYIWVNTDGNGRIAYAGANIENPTDPNIDVVFDFGEFAILPPGQSPQGIFVNTTRVDQFGFPVQLTVTGLDGFSQTVGESLTEGRDELFAKFIGELPSEFAGLAQAPYAPYRIMAPSHATFQTDGPNVNYLDAYITQVWNQYTNQDLVIDLKNGWAPFTGRVVGGKFRFTDGTNTYFINGKPSTSMVMLGNGLLDDPTGTTDVGKQLQLQAQLCAALNRRVAHRAFSDWWNSSAFYPAGQPANYFAKFWHDHSLNALAYGFAYDDVGSFSPSIHTPSPVSVTYTIGW